jgi:hypothetical protein
MHASRIGLRTLAVGAAAFALVVVAAGGVFAASNPPTVYACFNAYGQVAMSDTNQCKLTGGGRLVYWSTAGVPGPTGPTGPAGPTGAQGAPGVSGTSVLLSFPAATFNLPVFTGSEFTVGVGCTPSAGDRPAPHYAISNLSAGPVTYVIATGGSSSSGSTVSAGGSVGGGWNPTLFPGATDLWVFGAGEAFHVVFSTGPYTDTTCQVAATY